MNKYVTLLCLSLLSMTPCIAQIGIKTDEPIKILNVDTQGDNPSTNPQASDKLKDDLIFRLNKNSEANLVLGGEKLSSETEASLELNDPKKALLLNRVALTSVSDTTTVPLPRDGMIIYNTATDGAVGESVTPGTYMNVNKKWLRLVDKEIVSGRQTSSIKNIAQTVKSTPLSDKDTGANAAKISVADGDIIVPEAGRYLFVFRLYGSIDRNVSSPQYSDYYLYLFKKKGGMGKEELMDKTRMTIVKANGLYGTYSPMLTTSYLDKGDAIIIRFGHIGADSKVWSLVSSTDMVANRTSFAYWLIK